MAMERVDVRVEREILEELEDVARLYNINNRSEAIREAIYDYIEDKKDMWNSDIVKVSLPREIHIDTRMYIKMGRAKTLSEAITAALSEWCNGLRTYYLHEQKALMDIAKEKEQAAIAEKDGQKRARRFGRR